MRLPVSVWINSNVIIRNVVHTVGGQYALVVLQGVQFIIIARVLGPQELGKVASVTALTSILLPFSGLGLGNIAVMRLARGQSNPALCLGNALLVATVSGSVCILLVILGGVGFLRDSRLVVLILLFAVSEILLSKYVDIAAHIFYGLDRHSISTLSYNLLALMRLVSSIVLALVVKSPTAVQWGALHLTAAAVSCIAVGWVTVSRVGLPQFQPAQAWTDARQGVFFSISLSAKSIYTDIDKAVLARYAALDVVGAYTAGHRLIVMAFMPVMAVMLAAQAHMFRKGQAAGLRGTLTFARHLALVGVVYCASLAVLLYAFSPFVPLLLGSKFTLSSDVARTLAFLPLLLMLQTILSEALAGANHQWVSGLVHAVAAMSSLGLNLLLVPSESWRGSAYSAYVTQLLTLALLATAIYWLSVATAAASQSAKST